MIKRTIYFGNPAYLSLSNGQMKIKLPPKEDEECERSVSAAIEDLGYVIIDCNRVTLTAALIAALAENNTALITCDEHHMPATLNLPLNAHTLQQERFRAQIDCSLPLQKQLWKQTVSAKITNQARAVEKATGSEMPNMLAWAAQVRSNDATNLEARAAAFYWKELMSRYDDFTRDRFGVFPNNLLNYGYAVLRAVIARALVGKGLLPLLGLHHHNRYNAYCLADDIMEPYRPIVDLLVIDIIAKHGEEARYLTKEIKAELLKIPVIDVKISGRKRPLMTAAEETAASLLSCYEGKSRKISYPLI